MSNYYVGESILFNSGGIWCPALMEQIHEDGTFFVIYFQGNEQQRVHTTEGADSIRHLHDDVRKANSGSSVQSNVEQHPPGVDNHGRGVASVL